MTELKRFAATAIIVAAFPLFLTGPALGMPIPSVPGAIPRVVVHCIPACGSSTGWVRPVDAPIWGGFRQNNPDNPKHDGVDLGAIRGTPIRTAAAGVVVRVRCNITPASHGCDRDGSPATPGCGWYVDIRHAGNIYTRYCHMIRHPAVKVGQHVVAGQVIGNVGDSGHSSAPHLHFEVHLGDESRATAVDPIPFMVAHGAPLGTG